MKKEFAFQFAEFCGLHYVRLHGCWIHKYSSQLSNETRTTEQLWDTFQKTFNIQETVREFEVWVEGYIATGERGTAQFLGKFPGETFRDAVIAYKDSELDEYTKGLVDINKLSIWGCRLYDNEQDAKRNFG